jgi:hypothetical protein
VNHEPASEDPPSPSSTTAVYCIDTSALVNMARRYSPLDALPFRPLWSRVEDLVTAGRLVAPEEVRREIEAGQDELVDWARQHPELFVATTPELVEMTTTLVRRYPELAGLDKTRLHADPWVIALAMVKSDLFSQGVVVADESSRRPTAIPSVCQAESIECLTHVNWFGRQGWRFG